MYEQSPLPTFVPSVEKWYAAMSVAFSSAPLAGKRRYLLVAGMFAGHSANASVAQAERDLSAWHVDGFRASFRPSYAQQRWEELYDGLRTFLVTVDEDWFASDKWELVNDLASNVKWLGAVKASFALALCGYDLGCLDRHILDVAGYTVQEQVVFNRITNPKKLGWAAIVHYRFVHDVLYDSEPRKRQWLQFAQEQATFALTGHRVYFMAQGINTN